MSLSNTWAKFLAAAVAVLVFSVVMGFVVNRADPTNDYWLVMGGLAALAALVMAIPITYGYLLGRHPVAAATT